jgi:hypothetical protein
VSVSEFKTENNENNENENEKNKKINHLDRCAFSNPLSSSESRFAHIIFSKKNILNSVLVASDTVYYDLTNKIAQNWGIGLECRKKSASELYKKYSNKPVKVAELKEEVEVYMKEFDEKEIIEKMEREKRGREPDEDGFVVVKQRYVCIYLYIHKYICKYVYIIGCV